MGRQAFATLSPTGVNLIDGALCGSAWTGTSISYAFPGSAEDYGYGTEKDFDFAPVSQAMIEAAKFFLDTSYGSAANNGFAIEGFTKLNVSQGSDTDAAIRLAQSSVPPSAWADYPGPDERDGDAWFGTGIGTDGIQRPDYTTAAHGDWKFTQIGHEIGHAFGLKHGHEVDGEFPALALRYDSVEYSIMSYRAYVGDSPEDGYRIEDYGYAQTFMMVDIAALQEMYGANFMVNSGNTVYSWKPDSGNTWVNGEVGITNTGDNVIFATIWDGGGKHDRYDLSAYAADLAIDLRPGKSSIFSEDQLSDLDKYGAEGLHLAHGNIFNALLYHGDTRSLIEDATGGTGDDRLVGNVGNNRLVGNGGNDTFEGFRGNDTYIGGNGRDVFNFAAGGDRDKITDFRTLKDTIDLKSFGFDSYADVKAHASNGRNGVTFDFGHGDVLVLSGLQLGDLHRADFVL